MSYDLVIKHGLLISATDTFVADVAIAGPASASAAPPARSGP